MSGYVRIHRALIGHPAFRNDAEAMAFAWMVAKAAWKPTRVRYKERPINLHRGQLAVSQRDMARALDRDKAWIERLWKRLKSEAMVKVEVEAGVAVVTICNYCNYQASEDRREAANEARDEAGARQGQGTEQGREEGKKEYTPPSPRKRGEGATSIPKDWKPCPVSELTPKARLCAEEWTQASYETVAEGFALYWQRTGKKTKDWKATWCGWVIREHSKVLRDQKFGTAPTGKTAKVELSADDWEARARQLEAVGMNDNAAECRRKAEAMRRAA